MHTAPSAKLLASAPRFVVAVTIWRDMWGHIFAFLVPL
jgi:hypothetical protein